MILKILSRMTKKLGIFKVGRLDKVVLVEHK